MNRLFHPNLNRILFSVRLGLFDCFALYPAVSKYLPFLDNENYWRELYLSKVMGSDNLLILYKFFLNYSCNLKRLVLHFLGDLIKEHNYSDVKKSNVVALLNIKYDVILLYLKFTYSFTRFN